MTRPPSGPPLVESITVQVAVLLEGHRHGGVAKHLLDDLGVGSGGDGQGRGGGPQFV